ncbi:Ig-like domain-containing protein [Candidatus Woesebacteria bacterium]|nr:Ig-like domain-containing protein [Candidatus Woesebacteria bacterium]MCD8507730.1 Ig-like domain-containing protein [Candidatus Woesebacteria bacterium]MCD8527214.1 Ig-like domain-containing protein [Candidatus Woesebacteria bacterium]MCD8546579.1 Ig-like domain-containing protein [Candidatus Woesebacteria bacterium]
MARKISTRRAKIEERQARRQAFLAIVVAVLIGLFFLFVMMPLILRAAISLARNENPFQTEVEDTLPPQKPVIQPLTEFRSEKNLEITGYTEAGAQVSLFADGNELDELTADDSGAFTFTTTLEEGEHKVWLLAEDEAGNSSGITETYSVTIDTTKPTLEITEPENNKTFTLPREKTITVAGKMSEKGRVFVNGSRNATDEEGNFSTRLQLGEGSNTIKLYAEDEAGNRSDEQEVTVEYNP